MSKPEITIPDGWQKLASPERVRDGDRIWVPSHRAFFLVSKESLGCPVAAFTCAIRKTPVGATK